MSDSRVVKRRKFSRPLIKAVVAAAVIVVAAIIIALAGPWYQEGHEKHHPYYSLVQIHDGFQCAVLRGMGTWDSHFVGINNGTSSVMWTFNASSFNRGVWTAVEYPIQYLGGIALRLTAVDLEGDGNISPRDYIDIAAVNSSTFTTNVLYNFTLGEGHIAISGFFIHQSFEFENGKLVTGKQKAILIPA